MARRRDRGGASQSSDLHQSRIKTTPRANQYSESAASDRNLIAIFIFFFIVIPAVSVMVYRIKSASNTYSADSQAQQGGSLKANLNYQEILNENSVVLKNDSHRKYIFPTLAYVTPWLGLNCDPQFNSIVLIQTTKFYDNGQAMIIKVTKFCRNSKGYEMAKKFAKKFTHISPVWYDLKSEGTGIILEGRHNVDKGWISELRKKGDVLVLPRVVLEAFPKELLKKKTLKDKAIELVVLECKEMGYDGIVLESWSIWAAYGVLHDPSLRRKALQFIKQLGYALHLVSSGRNGEQQLQLVYVIGPPHSEKLQVHDFGPEDLHRLDDAVDGFSLMTYDFSGPKNPGPNAPLSWIRFTLQQLLGTSGKTVSTGTNKIFLGLNFYGNDFVLSGGGGAIVGREYLSLLEKHKPELQWEEKSGEHFFLYVDDDAKRHAVFYPSVKSIALRLNEAQTWRTGISIWEIGQGLDYFFDLL